MAGLTDQVVRTHEEHHSSTVQESTEEEAWRFAQNTAEAINRNTRRRSLEGGEGDDDELELIENAFLQAGVTASQRCSALT